MLDGQLAHAHAGEVSPVPRDCLGGTYRWQPGASPAFCFASQSQTSQDQSCAVDLGHDSNIPCTHQKPGIGN